MNSFTEQINNLYEKGGYLEKYGSSLLLVIIIFIIYFYAQTYFIIDAKKQEYKRDWPLYRCKPHIIPWAGYINAPDGASKSEYTANNLRQCATQYMIPLALPTFAPFNGIIGVLNSIFESVNEQLDKIRSIMPNIRDHIREYIENILNKVTNFFIPIASFLHKIKAIFKKIGSIGYVALYIGKTLWGIIGSIINFIIQFILSIIILLSEIVAILGGIHWATGGFMKFITKWLKKNPFFSWMKKLLVPFWLKIIQWIIQILMLTVSLIVGLLIVILGMTSQVWPLYGSWFPPIFETQLNIVSEAASVVPSPPTAAMILGDQYIRALFSSKPEFTDEDMFDEKYSITVKASKSANNPIIYRNTSDPLWGGVSFTEKVKKTKNVLGEDVKIAVKWKNPPPANELPLESKVISLGNGDVDGIITIEGGYQFYNPSSAMFLEEMWPVKIGTTMKDLVDQLVAVGKSGVPVNDACFVGHTLIELDNNEIIRIDKIKPGMKLKDGSIVTSIFKTSADNQTLYAIDDIHVTKRHRIFYNNTWIPVFMHPKSRYLNHYSEKYIYCINTNIKQININEHTFTDWDDLVTTELIEVLKKCNETEDFTCIKDMYKTIECGFRGDTKIKLKNNQEVNIKDIKVGTILGDNNVVLSVVQIYVDNKTKIKKYNSDTSNIFYATENINFFNNTLANYKTESSNIEDNLERQGYYHLVTNQEFFTINKMKIHDYNYSINKLL